MCNLPRVVTRPPEIEPASFLSQVRCRTSGATTRCNYKLTELSQAFIGHGRGSKWHAWFASRCPDRRLSTWLTTAVSCPTALGALCGQLTFRLAWCREHSAVMATELLQPRDLACGTLFQSSCVIQTSSRTVPATAEGTPFSGSMNTALCDATEKKLTTYLHTYSPARLTSYLKPSFSANPSHCSFSFSSSGLTT